MEKYDIIIAGGGAAGLGLAYQMINSPLKDQRILVIDKDSKKQNDRTWCFWADGPSIYDAILSHSWGQIAFWSQDFERIIPLQPYQYKMIRGIDFYFYTRQELASRPNVTLYQGAVDSIEDGTDGAIVRLDGVSYQGKWVFDSIMRAGDLQLDPSRFHYLKQHFLGWEIETAADTFDPTTATLFDFRTPQQNEMRFFYILPYSPRKALVEYTLFSANLLAMEEYENALRGYLKNILHIGDYRIEAVENAFIPMTDQPFPRRIGKHIMAIGTKGGRVKSSTGYAFARIQEDAANIIRSLLASDTPFLIQDSPARYRFYDRIMLQLMYRRGKDMQWIFTELFKKNSIREIFRFLDEKQSLPGNIRLMASLPTLPFLSALLKIYLLGKI